MLFSSVFFIFVFLPTFFILFFLIKRTYRHYFLLLASLSFYFWSEPLFFGIAFFSACFDYALGKIIYQRKQENRPTKRYLVAGIGANLIILFYYKYTNFFIASFNKFIPAFDFPLLDVILPIGVSFIVFEKITYLVDISRGTCLAAKSWVHYFNYVFLFPKLLAGPIIKYHEIENQLRQPSMTLDNFFKGLQRFIRGLIKKVFVADSCAMIVNPIFNLPADQLTSSYAWLGIIAFTVQIYFDFSGYSDMALGLARMLGFQLRENFNMPYHATSFTDFWQRWHISLSSWIKEYLYIPLGGNRISTRRTYVNLWICFLLSGLWHGANWTFVLWGAYHGFFLVLDKMIWLRVARFLPNILIWFLTFIFIMLSWVIFRSHDFTQISYYFSALFGITSHQPIHLPFTADLIAALLLGIMLSCFSLLPGYASLQKTYSSWHGRLALENGIYGILGFIFICKTVSMTYNPFLYFRF